MLYLVGGFAVLGGFLLLVHLFVNADPARLARNLKWAGIAVGAVAVYAAGGYRALSAYGARKGGEILRLTAQLRG